MPRHPLPEVDALSAAALKLASREAGRREIFRSFWELAEVGPLPESFDVAPRATVPYLNEPWYC